MKVMGVNPALGRLVAGAAALAGVLALAAAPAHADPVWTLYNESTAAPLTSSDTVHLDLILDLQW